MEEALQKSFRLQADLAFLVVMAKEWLIQVQSLVKGSIANDLLVADALLRAGFEGAFHTANINVVYMKDSENKAEATKALDELKMRFNAEQTA